MKVSRRQIIRVIREELLREREATSSTSTSINSLGVEGDDVPEDKESLEEDDIDEIIDPRGIGFQGEPTKSEMGSKTITADGRIRLTHSQLRRIIREVAQFAATAEEEAMRVNDQASIGLVTDPEHWEKYGIRTGEELAKHLLASTYSDYYKDLHGIRPRWNMERIKAMSAEEIQAEIDKLDTEAAQMEADDPDEWMEDRFRQDQEDWDNVMIDAVKAHPEDVPAEYLEYENLPRRTSMRRRHEGIMRITRKQLRRIIKEGIDIVNNETGELLVFEDDWETKGGTAPEAAARNTLKRLRITPIKEDPPDEHDVTDIYVEPSDWAVVDTEIEGKRRYRRNKRERERLDIENLLARLDQWAIEAGGDYEADNPGTDMQGVAWDLAASAEYSFEPDEWDELVWHFDGEEDNLQTYVADMVVG